MNGEIYNHEELRKQLPNHKFRTGSDCDVIAHLVSHLDNKQRRTNSLYKVLLRLKWAVNHDTSNLVRVFDVDLIV